MGVRFDDANARAIRIAERVAAERNAEVIVVRDLLGRNALALSNSQGAEELAEELRRECEPYVGHSPVIDLSEMLAPELLRDSRDRRPVATESGKPGAVSVIERSPVGADWLLPASSPPINRVAMYGFKGGVGRSTATFALAEHIARKGHVVLVVDLDLESPGVSTMLAPDQHDLPSDGIVDHLVEFAVGNDAGLDLVSRSTAIGELPGNGEVWFAAAAGRPRFGASYLDKLSRVYMDLPALPGLERGRVPFGARLEAAIAECENQVAARSRRPSVVILDSRSGIHDIAAVAITQLSNVSFLFATDNPQTWNGYEELFSRWSSRLDTNSRSELRARLQMVAPMVPQADAENYIATFSDHSQACFARTIYDDVLPDSGLDSFNFAPQDVSAPHYPIPIHHSVDLVGIVPGVDPRWSRSSAVRFAYEEFVQRAFELIEETTSA